MFRTVPLSIIRSFFYCTHSNGICHTGLLTACEQEKMLTPASCQQTCMTYTIAVYTVKTPDDGQRNCPKHVEFHSKNKFEKLVHLVGFIIRNLSWLILTVAPTRPPVQWEKGSSWSGRGVNLKPLLPRLRKRGGLSPLHHMLSRCGAQLEIGKLCLPEGNVR